MMPQSAGPLIALAWLAGLVWPSPGLAQTFACQAETAGQLSAQADVRCKCRWHPEGRITGVAAGYRWDCGVLRGRMNHTIPADLNAWQGDLSAVIWAQPDLPRRRWR